MIHPPMTYDRYAALAGLRASRLKLLRESPLHYRATMDNDSANRGMLRAIHALVLEPDTFGDAFVVYDGVRRGKTYDAVVVANDGKTILNPREEAQARATAAAILAHPIAGPMLAEPHDSEVTITWQHPATGIECKARLDWWSASVRRIIDLKTYGSTSPRVVGARAHALGAVLQGAHYVEGAEAVTDIPVQSYCLIVAEDKPPHDVAVFELRDVLHVGQQERERLMARLAECIASDRWPGRCEEVTPLVLPAYATDDNNDPDMGDLPEED